MSSPALFRRVQGVAGYRDRLAGIILNGCVKGGETVTVTAGEKDLNIVTSSGQGAAP